MVHQLKLSYKLCSVQYRCTTAGQAAVVYGYDSTHKKSSDQVEHVWYASSTSYQIEIVVFPPSTHISIFTSRYHCNPPYPVMPQGKSDNLQSVSVKVDALVQLCILLRKKSFVISSKSGVQGSLGRSYNGSMICACLLKVQRSDFGHSDLFVEL